MSFYKMFKALPLKSYEANPKKKITRKLMKSCIDNQEIYPPEGHVAVNLSKTDTTSKILFFGGASGLQESTWSSANSVYILYTTVSDDDINMDQILSPKLKGARFPSLHGSSAIVVSNSVFIWGGLNLETYSFSNEMVILDTATLHSNGEIKVETVQDAHGISRRKMTGEIPSGRSGHSLTLFSDDIVLFGGLSLPHRFSSDISLSTFKHITCDDKFYIFELQSLNWILIPSVSLAPRAFHSASVIDIRGLSRVLYLGGIYKSDELTFRYTLDNLTLLTKYPDQGYVVENVTASGAPMKGVSYHASVPLGPFVFVVGGTTDDNLHGTHAINVLNVETMSYETILIDSSLSCSGHSCVSLDDACLLVCGGYQKQYFVYTNKQMIPGSCEFGEACDIIRSSEINPLAWIQCEGRCKRWLHQFCAQVLNKTIHGKFICQDCNVKRKRKL